MPITKSAKKALRQSIKRKARNLQQKEAMKSLVKQVRKLAAANQKEEAKKLLSGIYQAIDKAAKKGLIKKNTAARKKSRLAKLLSR